MTTPAEAKRTALLAIPGAAGIAMVGHVWTNRNRPAAKQIPPPRIIAGAVVALVILTASAGAAPGMVQSFAVLVIVATIVYSGAPLIESIRNATR